MLITAFLVVYTKKANYN